jgi:hypothetical protein
MIIVIADSKKAGVNSVFPAPFMVNNAELRLTYRMVTRTMSKVPRLVISRPPKCAWFTHAFPDSTLALCKTSSPLSITKPPPIILSKVLTHASCVRSKARIVLSMDKFIRGSFFISADSMTIHFLVSHKCYIKFQGILSPMNKLFLWLT